MPTTPRQPEHQVLRRAFSSRFPTEKARKPFSRPRICSRTLLKDQLLEDHMKTFLLLVTLALAAIPAFAQSRRVLAEGTEIRVRTDQNIPTKPSVGATYS